MLRAQCPINEEERLRTLHELEVLDTPEEQTFDDITGIIAEMCNAPMAFITLIDTNRQYFKSHYGLDATETPREVSFCSHAILKDDLLIVEDATKDERFHDNPLVVGEPHIRFYAGAPLILADDIRIGTLCVVDDKPRKLSETQTKALQVLAHQVVSQLKLRTAVRELSASNDKQSAVVAELKRTQVREHERIQVLEKLAKDKSLDEILNSIVYSIENELPGSICSILLMDESGKHLIHGAAPNLPKFYNEAIHNLKIGPEVGSCGASAYSGKRVIVEDIENHPNWAPFLDLTRRAALVSCWSQPIIDSSNKVLGTFAIYHSTPHTPAEIDLEVMEYAVKLASIAIRRKQKDLALISAHKEAQRANQAKSEFLSRMTHELRTPMNAILGFSQLMESDKSLPEKHMNYVQVVLKAGNHLLKLIDEILDLAKIDSGHIKLSIEPVEIHSLIEECLRLIEPLAEKFDVNLNYKKAAGVVVKADRTRLKQALLNLLSNAVKYNRKDGSVKLDIRNANDDRLQIRIADTGQGIAEDQLGELFQPFNRLGAESTDIEGTGIGLSITKRIADLMNGSVGVVSEKGSGSTFWIELPKGVSDSNVLDVNQDPQVILQAEADTDLIRHTVLYIEDNPDNMLLVEEILKRHKSVHLLTSQLPELGIELARKQQPELILLDINMPGMNGYEVFDILQADENTQDIPVVAISAYAMPTDIQFAKDKGFKDYLIKPLNVLQFDEVIRHYILDAGNETTALE